MSPPEPDVSPASWASTVANLAVADPPGWARMLLPLTSADGLSISTLGDILASETISASGALASRLDELQFDLGEGPCWDALSTRRPVLEPDLAGRGSRSWPVLSDSLRDDQVSGLFAFPLAVGPLGLGAVDLYVQGGNDLPALVSARMEASVAGIARLVLRRALRVNRIQDDDDDIEFPRRLIHQATGAVSAQLHLAPDDAYLVIQGRALSDGSSMHETAEGILEKRIVFTMGDDGIEDRQ